MNDLLDALIDFTTADARLETSYLFHKMRTGRHRLGPKTSQLWKRWIEPLKLPIRHSCKISVAQATGMAPFRLMKQRNI